MQCCTCSKWVHLSCSRHFLSKFRAFGSSHSWSCLPPCRNTVTPSSDTSDMYTPQYNLAPLLLMLHSRRTLVSKPLIPHPTILYLLPLPPRIRVLLLAVLVRLLSSPDSLRVLQWNAGGLRARSTELVHFLSSHPVDLTASRNPILTHLPLSGFLDSLLCALIAPTLGLAFSLLMPSTVAAALSLSSGRVYPFLNFLPPLFLCSIPTLIM